MINSPYQALLNKSQKGRMDVSGEALAAGSPCCTGGKRLAAHIYSTQPTLLPHFHFFRFEALHTET